MLKLPQHDISVVSGNPFAKSRISELKLVNYLTRDFSTMSCDVFVKSVFSELKFINFPCKAWKCQAVHLQSFSLPSTENVILLEETTSKSRDLILRIKLEKSNQCYVIPAFWDFPLLWLHFLFFTLWPRPRNGFNPRSVLMRKSGDGCDFRERSAMTIRNIVCIVQIAM